MSTRMRKLKGKCEAIHKFKEVIFYIYMNTVIKLNLLIKIIKRNIDKSYDIVLKIQKKSFKYGALI